MYIMKRYPVALLRERLAEALDNAERGIPVVIERRGVRYTLAVERRGRSHTRAQSVIEMLDPALARGQWAWDWAPGGLVFKGRGRKRR